MTLAGGTFPAWAAVGVLKVSNEYYDVNTRDGNTQVTLEDTTLDVDGEAVAPIGELDVSPLETADYVLTARGHQGPITTKVTLTVSPINPLLPDRGGCNCDALWVGSEPWGLAIFGALSAFFFVRMRSRRRNRRV